jgi:hypothetical protein
MGTVLELRALNALRSLELSARNRLNETCERGNTHALAAKRAHAANTQTNDATRCNCPAHRAPAAIAGTQFWDLT